MCRTGGATFLSMGGVLGDAETADIWEATVLAPEAHGGAPGASTARRH